MDEYRESMKNVYSSRILQSTLDEAPMAYKDGNEISFNDILGTDADEIIDSIHLKLQVGKLYDIIDNTLDSRERYIIIHRFGLKDCDPLPQRELAKRLDISRSYVSRIEKKALEKLKDALSKC